MLANTYNLASNYSLKTHLRIAGQSSARASGTPQKEKPGKSENKKGITETPHALAERKIVPYDIRPDYTEKTTFVKRLTASGIGRRLTDVRTEATTI